MISMRYMTPPPGLSLPSPQNVCKLQRSLYGLRQAGRQWYAKLSTFLLSNNYSIFVADHSLFLKYNNDKLTVILVYVDDLVLTGWWHWGNQYNYCIPSPSLQDKKFRSSHLLFGTANCSQQFWSSFKSTQVYSWSSSRNWHAWLCTYGHSYDSYLPSLPQSRLPSWCWCNFPIQKTPWASNLLNQNAMLSTI